jgi:alpha-tubulin suppressor-like RCC1 family protein
MVIAIAAGDAHALALTAEGKVFAWGEDRAGQTNVPADLGEVTAIYAGAEGSAALTADGLRVWGRFDGEVPEAAHTAVFGRGSTGWIVA